MGGIVPAQKRDKAGSAEWKLSEQRRAGSLRSHLTAGWFGVQEDSRKSATCTDFLPVNTSINQNYCTQYQRHVNHGEGSGKDHHRWGMGDAEKRKELMLIVWELLRGGGQNNAFPVLSRADVYANKSSSQMRPKDLAKVSLLHFPQYNWYTSLPR